MVEPHNQQQPEDITSQLKFVGIFIIGFLIVAFILKFYFHL